MLSLNAQRFNQQYAERDPPVLNISSWNQILEIYYGSTNIYRISFWFSTWTIYRT